MELYKNIYRRAKYKSTDLLMFILQFERVIYYYQNFIKKKNNKQLGPNFLKTFSMMTDRHLDTFRYLDIFRYFLGIDSSSIIQDILTTLLMVIKLIKINNQKCKKLQNHGSQPILVDDVP